MSIEVAISFGALGRGRVHVETATRLIPSLSSGALERCTVGVRTHARSLMLRAALAEGAAGDRAAERLAFWTARAGGIGRRLEAAGDSVEAALASSDLLARDVAPEDLWSVLERGFGLLWERDPRPLAVAIPELRLCLDEPEAEGLRYAPDARRLFVPSALSPPVGDEFGLAVEGACRGGRPARGAVRVVAPGRADRAAEPGFVVALTRADGALHALLAERCAASPSASGWSLRRLLLARA